MSYNYIHRPTVNPALLDFPASSDATSDIGFGLENKLQTRRPDPTTHKLQSVDLARLLFSVPYTFRGNGEKQGGRLGDWSSTLELYP